MGVLSPALLSPLEPESVEPESDPELESEPESVEPVPESVPEELPPELEESDPDELELS